MDIRISGKVNDIIVDNKIWYLASSPADYMANYSGSGLPFANQQQAFYNTPNKGFVNAKCDGSFEIDLYLPNSYMVALGSVKVPPTLYIQYTNIHNETKIVPLDVSYGIPYRNLTYAKQRTDNSFYSSQFDNQVKDQWKILVDSSYPRKNSIMPENHWGDKPPL